MRNMGGLRERMPTTFLVYLVGALALAGIPPLAGFFSKDEILADASHDQPTLYVLLTAAAFLTAFYMGRQILMVFFGTPRSTAAAHASENPPIITAPLAGLAVLATLGGLLNLPAGLPGAHALTVWLERTFEHLQAGEFVPLVAVISTGLALVAFSAAWVLYGRGGLAEGQPDPLRRLLGPVFVALENKYWVDEIYDTLIIRRYVQLSNFLGIVVDGRWWHDGFHDGVLARRLSRPDVLAGVGFRPAGDRRHGRALGAVDPPRCRWLAPRSDGLRAQLRPVGARWPCPHPELPSLPVTRGAFHD